MTRSGLIGPDATNTGLLRSDATAAGGTQPVNRAGTTRPAAEILARLVELPLVTLDAIAPGTSLILAPHPDDETLGCGGLIAACCAAGRQPIIVCATDGAASHPGSIKYPPAKLQKLREDEMRAACAILGVPADRVHFLNLPDAHAPTRGPAFDAAAAAIAALANTYGVETIFATWPYDPHCDHEAAAAIARAAVQLSGARLVFYPVWGWLLPPEHALPADTARGHRLNIAAHLPLKRRAIAAHASQYGDLITDSPTGFRLPQALLAVFDRPFEVFLDP